MTFSICTTRSCPATSVRVPWSVRRGHIHWPFGFLASRERSAYDRSWGECVSRQVVSLARESRYEEHRCDSAGGSRKRHFGFHLVHPAKPDLEGLCDGVCCPPHD